MPERASRRVPLIVTGTIFPFGGQMMDGEAAAVTTGAVTSMLIGDTVSDELFSALSVHVVSGDEPPVTSAVRISGGGAGATRPESESAQVNASVTGRLLIQPFALGAGVRPPEIVGAVSSMFNVSVLVVLRLPAPFCAKNETTVVPSAVTGNPAGLATSVGPPTCAPESEYDTDGVSPFGTVGVSVTWTLVLFQP